MGHEPLFLGIDLGTSLLKVQVIDISGRMVAETSVPLKLHIPQHGWAEQHPDDWWAALITSCKQLFGTGLISPSAIAAISVSGQMHGAVFLDRQGQSIRPCLIWADGRPVAQVAEMETRIPRSTLIAITGNVPNTSFTAAKILWVQQNEPDVYRRTRCILLPKDYLRWRLTGTFATEVSDASATLMFDLKQRNWSPGLLDTWNVRSDLLPPVYESTAVVASVSIAAANSTGLCAGTPVVAGGGDAACGALGAGMAGDPTSAHAVLTSIGTSGQVFAVTDTPLMDPQGRIHSLCHVVPGRWYVMGAVLAAGVALRWLRDLLIGADTNTAETYESLTAEAAQVAPGCDGLLFLPYLLGERTPHMDPHARSVFFGLRLDHTRAHLVRSVMEGVVFALRDGLEAVRELGMTPLEVRAVGGGARSRLWRDVQRDTFRLPLRTSAADHSAAFGAALLAAVGVGAFRDAAHAVQVVALTNQSEPDGVAVARYEDVYQRYRRLYPALIQEFPRV